MDFKIENFIGTFDNVFSNEYCQSIIDHFEKLNEFQASLKDLKMKHSISPLENPLEIKKTRRIIARLKTFKSNL